jgi:DNA-binding CsgD family transcriptional regulator
MVTKSDLLRVQDVRDAYRRIGECRDLGSDSALWHSRMLEGLCRLVGPAAATGGEGTWLRPRDPVRPVSAFDVGFDPHGHERFNAYMRASGPRADPVLHALQHVPDRLITRTRREVVSDRDWHRSASFNDYRRVSGIDHQVISIYQTSPEGAVSVFTVHRAIGERDFSTREVQLLRFFHQELGRLIGHSRVGALEPSPEQLSPRLRQTLTCLLDGDSEKQVAGRLGLSRATTHQYVTALYRHFKVGSRAQLLVHVLKRGGQAPGKAL